MGVHGEVPAGAEGTTGTFFLPGEPLELEMNLLITDPGGEAPSLREVQGDPTGPTDDGPRNYQRPDALILDELAKTLALEPDVDSFTLEIHCQDGDVKVTGELERSSTVALVEAIAASVFAVHSVDVTGIEVSKGIVPAATSRSDEVPSPTTSAAPSPSSDPTQ